MHSIKRTQWLACFIFILLLISFNSNADSPDSNLKQKYQDAITAGKKANEANGITIGLWTGAGAVCGYSCFNYLIKLTAARNALLLPGAGHSACF